MFDGGLTKGLKLGKGWVFLTGEYRDRNRTNRAGPDPRDQIVVGDGGNNAVPQPNHWVGDAETRDYLSFVNLQIPTGVTSFLYAFGGMSHRAATAPGFYRRALQFTQNWPQIYPIGFLPLIETDVVDGSGTIGVRGIKRDWYWDLSVQGGRNSMDFNITNTLNASLGPTPKTEFFAGTLAGNQVLANFDLSRSFKVGLAGPLNVAFGTEFRREGYEIKAGEPDSYRDGGVLASNGAIAVPGAQVFPGFRPSNAVNTSRNNVAFYADLEGDVTKRLRVQAAGRFERYSDFGSNLDGQVTLRIRAHERLVLRGSASTGFRAPSLAQSNFSAVSTNFLSLPGQGTVPVEVGTFAVASPVARALGATDLKPEDSVQLTAGFAFTPSPSFDFTADYYNIKIDDRIVFSGNFTGGAITALLAPLGATGARFFTNAINTRTDWRRSHRQIQYDAGQRQHPSHVRGLQLQPDTHPGRRRHAAATGRPGQRALRPRGARAHRVRSAKQPGSRHRRLDEEPLRCQCERRAVRQLLCEAVEHHWRGRSDVRREVDHRPGSELSAAAGDLWRGRAEPLRRLPGTGASTVAAPGGALLDDQHVRDQRTLPLREGDCEVLIAPNYTSEGGVRGRATPRDRHVRRRLARHLHRRYCQGTAQCRACYCAESRQPFAGRTLE